MPEGHDATIEVCNIMSFVFFTQILKQSVLKPASPGITLSVGSFSHYLFIFYVVQADKNLTFKYIIMHLSAMKNTLFPCSLGLSLMAFLRQHIIYSYLTWYQQPKVCNFIFKYTRI